MLELLYVLLQVVGIVVCVLFLSTVLFLGIGLIKLYFAD